MTSVKSTMGHRSDIEFTRIAREAFSFLLDEGFCEEEALPTLLRYKRGDVEVDVYHGRQSYEIGVGISFAGERYAISEVLRLSNAAEANNYRNPIARTSGGVAAAMSALSSLLREHGARALSGDAKVISDLKSQRDGWSVEYALDVLEGQVRPLAEEAFRSGEYAKAAELYGRIRGRLSSLESKKLALAEERSSSHN